MTGIAFDCLRWAGRAALFGVGLAVVLALVVLIALVAPMLALASALPTPEKKPGRCSGARRFGGDGALRAKPPGAARGSGRKGATGRVRLTQKDGSSS